MKGLWKENLSGWNHKDSKRKKTNRNHTIKDNINQIKKSLYNENYVNNENLIKNEYETIEYKDLHSNHIILNKKINLYLIDLTYKDKKNNINNVLFKGFFIGYNNDTIIDYKTKREICDLYNINNQYVSSLNAINVLKVNIVKEIGLVDGLNLDLIEIKKSFNGVQKNIKYKETNIDLFFINKKLTNYRYDPKTSKNLENFTNRKNRMIVRNFIKNGNFEKEDKLPFKINHNKFMYLD